jgi:hypothetical protein
VKEAIVAMKAELNSKQLAKVFLCEYRFFWTVGQDFAVTQ